MLHLDSHGLSLGESTSQHTFVHYLSSTEPGFLLFFHPYTPYQQKGYFRQMDLPVHAIAITYPDSGD